MKVKFSIKSIRNKGLSVAKTKSRRKQTNKHFLTVIIQRLFVLFNTGFLFISYRLLMIHFFEWLFGKDIYQFYTIFQILRAIIMLLLKVFPILFVLCYADSKRIQRPNIIIIVADDLVRHKRISIFANIQLLLMIEWQLSKLLSFSIK